MYRLSRRRRQCRGTLVIAVAITTSIVVAIINTSIITITIIIILNL